MHPVVVAINNFATKYPAKVPTLIAEMSKRTTVKFTTLDQVKSWVEAKIASNPGLGTMVKTVIVTLAGDQALEAIFPSLDTATKITAPSVKAFSPNRVGQLVNTNAGDGQPGTIWGQDASEVQKTQDSILEAFALIEEVAPIFGGHLAMAKAFDAIHSLEPDHFRLYRQYRKTLG